MIGDFPAAAGRLSIARQSSVVRRPWSVVRGMKGIIPSEGRSVRLWGGFWTARLHPFDDQLFGNSPRCGSSVDSCYLA